MKKQHKNNSSLATHLHTSTYRLYSLRAQLLKIKQKAQEMQKFLTTTKALLVKKK